MDKGSRTLGWFGLIVGGSLSVGANVRSIHLPGMPDVDLGSYVVAVAPVALAMLGIEQVARWKHLPNALRFGIVGMASLIAAVASWTHIVSVMKFYGQAEAIAYTFPLAVDGIMLLSSLSLFVSFPDKPEPVQVDAVDTSGWTWTRTDADNGADSLPVDTEPDTDTDAPDTALDTDTLHVLVPATRDMDTTDTAEPAPVPRPRRTRADAAWKALALDMIRAGEPATDREIAERILGTEGYEETWPSLEAGRKAVSRLR